MAITLGTLRTFCQEIASPDSSGGTADREFMIWINGAIKRLFAEIGWDRILKEQKLTILPEETGSALTVTKGSLSCSLGGAETFLAKYVTGEWDFYIGDEGSFILRLASIDNSPTNTTGTFRTGDEWIKSSGVKTWEARKTKYDLPDDAKQLHRAQIMGNGDLLVILPPHEFDHQKSYNPAQSGSYPRVCCLRKGHLEIWPHPGDSYVKLGLSYRKGAPTYTWTSSTHDSTEVDWDEEWIDLLHKAILLEAAIYQGEGSPVNYPVVFSEYETRLRRYRGLNSVRAELGGPMNLKPPMREYPHNPRSFSWVGPLTDV